MKKDLIHIAFGVYDKTGDYSGYTGVTIASILNNTKSQVKIHILHDDTMTPRNKEKFKQLIQCFSQEIEFHTVMLPKDIDKFSETNRLSPGTLFRLNLADVLVDISKVIYLDSDIIVNLDIRELWEEDISQYALGAILYEDVEDQSWSDAEIEILPFESSKYFNAGVLYLNLERINLQFDMRKECMDFLYEYPDAKNLDEAALNYVFQQDCIFLPNKYNYFPYSKKHLRDEKKDSSKYVYHFLNVVKPWYIRRQYFSRLYWRYLSQTPWGERTTDFLRYYEQSLGLVEEDIINGHICSRKLFIKNFIIRLWKEVKLKIQGK